MDFPKIQSSQHAVITAEVKTGIILTLDGQRRQGDIGEVWRVFDSLAAAREFAVAEVAKNPLVEFGIYDYKNHPVQVIRHSSYDHLA